MPGYYNPNNLYPATYANQMGYSASPMQQNYSGSQPILVDISLVMPWVDGEAAARAFQQPVGWPANKTLPLWDSTDTCIYLKSWSPMGIPNPIQKIPYTVEYQHNQGLLMGGNNGNQNNGVSEAQAPAMNYVTRDDLETVKQELMEAMRNNRPANVSGMNGSNGQLNQMGQMSGMNQNQNQNQNIQNGSNQGRNSNGNRGENR